MSTLEAARELRSLWRGWRYGLRASIALGWQHPLVMSLDGPNQYRRAIALSVTAPKHEEFVAEKGRIEAKARRLARWKLVAKLEDMLPNLPHPVKANRRWVAMVEGRPLAQQLRAILPNPREICLRITVEDWYGMKARSSGLNVRVRELVREEYR